MKSIYILLIVPLLIFSACKKFDDYKKYAPGGERTYPGKADSIKAYPGINRVQLVWLTTDPKIRYFKVFWNNGSDSLKIDAKHTATGNERDTTRAIIANLEERNYAFNIRSYDANGNISIPVSIEQDIYGDNYKNGLLNRGTKSISVFVTTGPLTAQVKWGAAEATDIGVELMYTDKDDVQRKVVDYKAVNDTLSKLINYKPGTPFSYRTLFAPVKGAIDTFYSKLVTIPAPVITYMQLDKSKFREYVLPGDAPSAWGWQLNYLWDNNAAEGRGFHTPDLAAPHHFTFDMGVTASIREMKLWQREMNPFAGGNVKKFEVWGSNAPAVDGSYTGWTKLVDGESVKPSGSPAGTVTAADVAYAKAGEKYLLPDNTPAVRYLRIKILEKWSNTLSSHMMEISLWGVY